MSDARKAELAASLAEVEERIGAACKAAGRDRDDVRLLAVTKTFPALDAALLADLGALDLAENRDQEAGAKAEEVAGLRPDARVRWHMVGSLQRNKARSVVRWADEVQSVDSERLAEALAKATRSALDSGQRDQPLDVLIQVSLDDDPKRGGTRVNELDQLAERIAHVGDIRLRGLMAVAPLGIDPAEAFEKLARASERLRADHPNAREISAGMSNDLEQAIAHGSTCVRVGTALLGGRGLASP
ncbi:YggS family pyridoxal phosphate-dependent enzyme [Amycolatopsis sp. BJA-103]|uniref:YggS family pyridoxal phosphate-dependent enzyme n=1 Tax=unclassified Amycolatopsis TaxID=2618356 RepID=UPI000C76E793|nr:YggS family pyridoxal phosphate-dependent enzyme [Amycolatopsis sp. BJA-103]AUI60515.1 YggS family pyridoxal phosphate enzyme [Amycolatopsis sp. BJA-103]PNE16540.1 YggS family pyridoxal phosphate enzyme [Amycolatopsis sp. BJA-103]